MLIITSRNLFGQWNLNASVEHSGCLNEIEFTTATSGYIVANNLIATTADAGETWNFDISLEGAFRIIDFINHDTVLICCYPEIGTDIMISYDGGVNWSYPSLHTSLQIQDVEFLNNARIVTAESIEPVNSIIHIVDNFYEVDLGIFVLSETLSPFDLDFPTDNIGFVCGYLYTDIFSTVFKSIDGGLTWYTNENMYGPIYHMSFPDPIVGYGIGDERRVWKTVDSGETWIMLSFDFGHEIDDENFALDDIYFYNENIGFLETYTYQDNGDITMEIRRTNDGGETWYLTDYPFFDYSGAESFFCTSADTCYFVTCDNIYKTTNGGGVDTLILNINLTNGLQFEITPNPATDFILLNISKNIQIQNIYSYNLYGQAVSVEFNESGIADITNLNSGIYFTLISTSAGTQVKKWIKE